MLKNTQKILLIFIFFAWSSNFAYSQEIIELEKIQKFDIQYKEQINALKGSLFVDDALEAQNNINEQQKADLEDIENLWNSTVENNPMIAFCLKKLAIPAEQRRIHSTLFAKSMTAIISGAAILPSFLGLNYGIQSGAYTAGKIATGLINKTNNQKLENPAITDTEAIELASLVEELQDEIIVDYYNYKGSLIKLKKCREQILLHNKNYADALEKNKLLEISIASTQYEDELVEEYKLKQEAKKYQLALIRLAGKKTVKNLNVARFDLTTQNVDKKELNYEKKFINANLVPENSEEKNEKHN